MTVVTDTQTANKTADQKPAQPVQVDTGLAGVSSGGSQLRADFINQLESDQKKTAPAPAQNSLLPALADLKERGVDLKLTRGVIVNGQDFHAASTIETALLGSTENKLERFTTFSKTDPETHVRFQLGANSEIAPALRDMNSVAVAPLLVNCDGAAGGMCTITVRNALSKDNAVIYTAKVNVPRDDLLPAEDAEFLRAGILQAWKSNVAAMKASLEQPAAAQPGHEPDYVVTVNKNAPLDAQAKTELQALQDHGYKLSAGYYPDKGSVDRVIDEGIQQKLYDFNLTPQKLAAAQDNRIRIDGEIGDLTLIRDFNVDSVKRDPKSNKPTEINGQPTFAEGKDADGNIITRSIFLRFPGDSQNGREVIFVLPPLTKSGPNDPGFTELKADLSSVGVPLQIPAVLERKALRELGSTDGRDFVTNLDAAEAQKKYAALFPAINKGINDAEGAFGFKPSEKANQVFIVGSDRPNAFFNQKDPGTVVIENKFLDNPVSFSPRYIGLHETTHLVDGATNWRLSGGELEALYGKIAKKDPKFFDFINEKNFLPGAAFGHAQENSKEFLATLMNTMYLDSQDPAAWEKNMQQAPPKTRGYYLEALKAVQANINTINEAAQHGGPDAIKLSGPIQDHLEHRIAWLQKNQNSAAD